MNLRTSIFRSVIVSIMVACLASVAAAQSEPAATAPTATAPTSTPARREVVVPPGFHRISSGRRTVLCEAPDDAWVSLALERTGATTLPTTMPAELSQGIVNQRDVLKARLAADLVMSDPAVVDKFIDETLLPALHQLERVEPPIFYLVCTRERLKELLKAGWEDSRFYYNRAADDIAFNPDLRMSDDRPMDDMLMPSIYTADEAVPKRAEQLSAVIARNESAVADAIARRGQVVAQLTIIEFIHKQTFVPLKLRPDQQWLGIGAEAVLSTRYMQAISGIDANQLLMRMIRDDPRNPIRSATIDLIHPTDQSTLRPEWVGAYGDAFRVKSSRVVHDWLAKAGDSAISMTIVAMRASPPPDGTALVRLINTTSGIDLTNELKSK